MRRGPFSTLSLLMICSSFAGCGGGGANDGGSQPPPPSPQAGFTIALSTNSVSVPQGSASAPVTVSINAQNGFSSNVQVSFAGLPAGVTSNPANAFSISPGQNVAVLFGAASNAATGQFNVTANGTSGSLSQSQSQSITLAIQPTTLVFVRPTEVLALSSGQALVCLRWNPAANSFTDLTSLAPAVFQSGAGVVAGLLNSEPARITATDAQTVFVGLAGDGGSCTAACNNCLGQLNLQASPPSYQIAMEPDVTSLTGAPLFQADLAGDTAYLAYDSPPGGPFAIWNAATPNDFFVSTAQNNTTDLSTAADGTFVALRTQATEIRNANLTLISTPAQPEVENVPNRVAVPGLALHPSGALVYQPFLDGSPPAAPPATGIHGGVDIRDAHNGQLRLPVYLPEPFAMLNTDVDGLHGEFLTTDQNGQQLFALTSSGLTIVQLANVPLGIGTPNPSSGPAAGGVSVTLRGSGFQSGITANLGGKPATVALTDMNTLTLTTPATNTGPQQLILTNPDGESVSPDAAFTAQ
jgi:IPT/TIG domain